MLVKFCCRYSNPSNISSDLKILLENILYNKCIYVMLRWQKLLDEAITMPISSESNNYPLSVSCKPYRDSYLLRIHFHIYYKKLMFKTLCLIVSCKNVEDNTGIPMKSLEYWWRNKNNESIKISDLPGNNSNLLKTKIPTAYPRQFKNKRLLTSNM